MIHFSFLISCNQIDTKYIKWEVTGGGQEKLRYSSISNIDTNNVNQLKVAWEYRSENGDSTKFGVTESNPIIIDNILYAVSPKLKVFALDAATGKQIWKFDPSDTTINKRRWENINVNRGVAFWKNNNDKRIIFSAGPYVYAINALDGTLIKSFGENGSIDLRKGLDAEESQMYFVPTSPAAVYKNLFILSGLVSEETPGHIRAFDIVTGKQKWIFHTIPHPGEKGYDSWEDKNAYKFTGSTNAWAGFSIDEKRGMLFAPIGNPTNDFYGGLRKGDALFGNCIVALEAETGKLKWYYQTVHHDVWDMDPPTAPSLVTIKRNGKNTDAVIQTTKTGMVFILERDSGKPVYPVEERIVSALSTVKGEKLSSTQPFPTIPKPFARQQFSENDLNGFVDDSSYQDILSKYRTFTGAGIFTPPSTQGTIVFPGYDGGGEWGGATVDPTTNILYVNANEMPWILKLVERSKKEIEDERTLTNLKAGKLLYTQHCMRCHGSDLQGNGTYPTLTHLEKKFNMAQVNELITGGRRMMPGFPQLSKEDKKAIASYILNKKELQIKHYTGNLKKDSSPIALYSFNGYEKFLTKEGYPAIKPPWGTLNAINLNTGEYVWKIPFGEFEELKKKGIPTTGRENYGGSVVTAGGLLFIAATADSKFRAFNKRTGDLLWETTLPAPGVSTPAVYQIDGKQYVVIACGGSKWKGPGMKQGDSYVAFALK